MRTRSTNFLQSAVLITGIIYFIIGLAVSVSPLWVLRLFAENISENWLDLVRDNELVAPIYYICRGFSALLASSGISMVMPLFDPLKYRGLIYYNGIIFPFFASIIFVYNGLFRMITTRSIVSENLSGSYSTMGQGVHPIIVLLGIIFVVLFIFNLAGIIVTRKDAGQGIE